MKNILFLMPRLDVMFKEGDVPDVRGPIPPIRQHWAKFAQQVLSEYGRRGYEVDVLEMPLWQFENQLVQSYLKDDYDYVFIPHKEAARYPIVGKTKPLYYMQTQFPWIFSVDPKGWGSGASVYPFISQPLAISPAFNKLRDFVQTGESKFGQVSLGTNLDKLPQVPFAFFPCQLPHDETIKHHSSVSVETALALACQATGEYDIPLIVKGHPVNPGSMEPLKRIVSHFNQYKNVRWLDEINIQDALKRAFVTITVNSGVGFESILHGTPVICFGRAEYDCVACPIFPTDPPNRLLEVIRRNEYTHRPDTARGFFEHWYDWCYDTTIQASFNKLPS